MTFDPDAPNSDGANTPKALLAALKEARDQGQRISGGLGPLDNMVAYLGEAIDGDLLDPYDLARAHILRNRVERAREDILKIVGEVSEILRDKFGIPTTDA
jgi:hypothetical protein